MILVFYCWFFHAVAWLLICLLVFLMLLLYKFFDGFDAGWMFGIFCNVFAFFFFKYIYIDIRCLMVFDLFAGFCFLIGFDVSCCFFLVVARS